MLMLNLMTSKYPCYLNILKYEIDLPTIKTTMVNVHIAFICA